MTILKLLSGTVIPTARQSSRLAQAAFSTRVSTMGDLNNTAAAREIVQLAVDSEYQSRSFAISADKDDADVRARYRPFLLSDEISASDWVARLELSTALKTVDSEIMSQSKDRLKVLVLYGSLRTR